MPSILVSICNAVTKSDVPADLEVHVAHCVFGTKDVGDWDVLDAVLVDETHSNAGNGGLRWARQRPSVDSDEPQTEAMELEPFDAITSDTRR